MIEQQLTLFEAYRLGYDRDEKVRQFVDGKERVLAGDALRKREVDDKVITEEVIAKVYQWLDKELKLWRMKFVFTSDDGNKKETEKKVQQVYGQLQQGEDFKKLAAEVSSRINSDYPGVVWKGSFATMGRFDVVDIVESDDLKQVEKAPALLDRPTQ